MKYNQTSVLWEDAGGVLVVPDTSLETPRWRGRPMSLSARKANLVLGGTAVAAAVGAACLRRRSLTVLPDPSWAPPGPGVRPAGEG